jgi:putative FmdB family regulatory protein
MPIYEYQCKQCHERQEVIGKFTDPPMTECPSCGGEMKKLMSSPAIQFKGSGFYKTDYASPSASSSPKGDQGDSKSRGESDSKSESKSESKSDSKSETKSETKTESKSETKSESKPEPKSASKASE